MFNSDNPRSTLCRVPILRGGSAASTPRSSWCVTDGQGTLEPARSGEAEAS